MVKEIIHIFKTYLLSTQSIRIFDLKFIILLLKKIDQNFNNNLSKKLNLIILDEIFLSNNAL